MKLLENYEKAVEDLAEYFNYDNFGDYAINIATDSYWGVEEDYVGWAESIEDYDKQDGEYFQEECSLILRGKDLTAVLTSYNREKYWNIFDNKKEEKNNQ